MVYKSYLPREVIMKSKIKGMTDTEYTAHMKWLSIFTDCKEVKSVPSNTKGKVQRKTNKSNI
jgi:hypothetical protein